MVVDIPKKKNKDSTIYSTIKTKGLATTEPKTDAEPAAYSPWFCPLALCLGMLCGLLMASISAIIFLSEIMKEHRANFKENLSNLTKENQQLIMEKIIVENKTEEVSRDRDDLNWKLNVILKFDTFPVNEYCPEKNCQPCQKGWILFQEKCYLFYKKAHPWMTWKDSRKYCQDRAADLVVIDSLQEQEFIANNTEFYFDKYHGYWIGLQQTAEEDWFWVDGRNDTLGYWMKNVFDDTARCVLMIPKKKPTASWDAANCEMWNKFICENEVLIWSN